MSANGISKDDWQPLCDMLREALVKRLAEQDHNATGALSNSIEVLAKEEVDRWFIEVWANNYGLWVNNGRKPGTMPPISVIRQWMDERNIGNDLAKEYQKRGLAFVIARSIKERGIAPQGGYSSHYSRGNSVERTGFVDSVIAENEDAITEAVTDIVGKIADWIIFNKYRNTIKFINDGNS